MNHEKNIFVEKAIKIAGSQVALGEHVGKAQSLVSDWLLNRKRVSVGAVPLIEELTQGEVKGYQLRPDLPKIFPHPNQPPLTPPEEV